MLHHHILHVLQVLDGVDALPPVLADVGQRVLDVLDVAKGIVELAEARAYPVQLRLDGCLVREEDLTDTATSLLHHRDSPRHQSLPQVSLCLKSTLTDKKPSNKNSVSVSSLLLNF